MPPTPTETVQIAEIATQVEARLAFAQEMALRVLPATASAETKMAVTFQIYDRIIQMEITHAKP